jgi:phenylalanine-4-hydroxylase
VTHAALVHLDPDHPGFRDAVYRRRRDEIAAIALSHVPGSPVPDAPYTPAEHALWARIQAELRPVQDAHVCREVLALQRTLALPEARLPQLREVNARLTPRSGFRMEPVAGFVQPADFFAALAEHRFLSTQYIRHTSVPLYTPEPDVVHELAGHAASLAHPDVAALNVAIGRASVGATASELVRLERVYWFTMEFGVAYEDGALKAWGAGLLSSFGELQTFAERAERGPWDLDVVAATPYDPSTYQATLFPAPSLLRALHDVRRWVVAGGYRDRRVGRGGIGGSRPVA